MGWLVLRLRKQERIYIGESIVVSLVRAGNGTAKLAITAPKDVIVDRQSVAEKRTANPRPVPPIEG